MKEVLILIAAGYVLLVNIIAFAMYGIDKNKAKEDRRRISEKSLFLIAGIGGSIGAMLGMKVFRHKTKHWYFVVGIPLILIVQILLIVGIWYLIYAH